MGDANDKTLVLKHIFNNVIQHLENLSPDLYYHGAWHTLDVMKQAQRIAKEEGIVDPEDLFILEIASMYHDNGFLKTYSGHEEESCRMAREQLTDFGVNQEQIERICEIIMATKLPQSPTNKLAEILCDADLDYLGRDDFDEIADKLYRELQAINKVDDKFLWNSIQLNFFESHNYFTASQRNDRNPMKQINAERIREEQRLLKANS